MASLSAIAAALGIGGSAAGSAASVGTTLATVGSLVGAAGTIATGVAANNAAQFEAEQQEERGKEEFAAAQRDAQQKRREGELVMSRQRALAAAGGDSLDSPTIVRLMTDTAADADYNARTAMYGGESRRRGLYDQASATRRSGRASLLGSVFSGFGQAASGLSGSGFGGGRRRDPWAGLR